MKWILGAVVLVVTLGATVTAPAIVILSDGNSDVAISPDTQAGVFSWLVDGQQNLFRQWFWFRVGDDSAEQSVDTLNLISSQTYGNNKLDLIYQDPERLFDITLSYGLLGGSEGSGWSDLTEQIRIRNLTSDALDFHFFQYSDFDLGGTAVDDGACIVNGNTVAQWDENHILSETVITPAPDHWSIDLFANTVISLTDSSATTLGDETSPMGPGDITWAFQWDTNIRGYGSYIISKDKGIRPIPDGASTAILFGMALTGIRLLKRKLAC